MPKQRRPPDVSFFDEPSGPTVAGARVARMFASGVSEEVAPQRLSLELLHDNPFQPRRTLDPAGVAELAQVIRTQGFQGTLVARRHPTLPGAYELAFGHRRRAAAQMAGLTTLPVVVQPLTNEDMLTLAITENVQRTDLTPLEEGDTYRLMIEELGYTQEQVAQEIGKDRGYVVNRLRAARAPEDVRDLLTARPDSLGAVVTLVKVEDPTLRGAMITGLLAGRLAANDLPGYLAAAQAVPTPPPPRATPKGQDRPPIADESDGDETAWARIGGGKLRVALRTLHAYRDTLPKRQHISLQEYATLLDLQRLIDTLCTEGAPPPIEQE